MYAVAATTDPRSAQSTLQTPQGKVYGLFANSDGSGAEFSLIAAVDDMIAGLASRNGTSVLIGTQTGRILSLDSASRLLTDQQVRPSLATSGTSVRLDDLEPGRAFALYDGAGRLLRYDGSSWQETSRATLIAFEADPRPHSRLVYAATEKSVLFSTDDGGTWADVSRGLPARPHCNDLRLAADGHGGHDLYLATYGRSVWKLKTDLGAPVPLPPHIPGAVIDIIAGVIEDGGGLISIGGQILRIPPRGPVRDILGALAIEEIARTMSKQTGRAIRLAAMQTVCEIAEAQISALKQSL